MVDAPKIRNIAARLALADVKAAHAPVESLLIETGLTLHQITREDGWIPYLDHAKLLENAARELDNPVRGLMAATAFETRELGVLAYVGLASHRLDDVLHSHARYWKLQTDAWTIALTLDSRSASVELIPAQADFYRFRQASETMVGGILRAYRTFLDAPLAPKAVHFVHEQDRSRSKSIYADLLGCPVDFNRNRCQIIFDAADLMRPIKSADDRLLRILKSHCEQTLSQRDPSKSELTEKIRQRMIDLLPNGQAKATVVASEIGLSERTMHRRLAEDGTCFGDLLCNGQLLPSLASVEP